MTVNGVHLVEPLPPPSDRPTPAVVVFDLAIVALQFLQLLSALLVSSVEPVGGHQPRNLENLLILGRSVHFFLDVLFQQHTQKVLHFVHRPWNCFPALVVHS